MLIQGYPFYEPYLNLFLCVDSSLIFYGKTNRKKKTNYIHLSKRTKLKHKKWK